MNKGSGSGGHSGSGRFAAPRTPQRAISPTQDNAPALDSTQTLRLLTQSELADPRQQQWYAIQLAVSDRPISLDVMPQLDVFAAYQLYVIRQQSSPRHVLRLGFFSDEISAQVIYGYLKTFFAATIVRVSAAEQARFADSLRPGGTQSQPPTPRAAGVAQVMATRDDRSTQPAATATVTKPAPQQAVADVKRPAKPAAAGASQPRSRKSRSLGEELLEEARQIQISKSGKHRVPERTRSWLSRLLGRSKS